MVYNVVKEELEDCDIGVYNTCLLYTSPENLVDRSYHGEENGNFAKYRSPVNCPQLRFKDIRVCKAETDPAHSKRGVFFLGQAEIRGLLI